VPVTGFDGVAAAGVPIGGVSGPGSLPVGLVSQPARPIANAAETAILIAVLVFMARLISRYQVQVSPARFATSLKNLKVTAM
jgi:hypothetical protein